MDEEQIKLLRRFAQPGSPCAIFTPRPNQMMLAVLKRLASDGLIRSLAGPLAVQGDNLWFECVVLTDESGRIAAGLEPIRPAKPVRTLFD